MGAAAVFAKIDKVKPIYDVAYKVILTLCKLFLIATIFVTSWQVAGRFIAFVSSPAWTEEVVLTLMAYMSLLAAGLAIRRRAHIRMVALDRKLPKMAIKVLDIFADVLIMGFCYVLIVYGYQFAETIGGRGSFTSMPNVSLFWRFLPVPLGGICMIFFNLEVMYDHIKAFFIEEETTAPAEAEETTEKEADSNGS